MNRDGAWPAPAAGRSAPGKPTAVPPDPRSAEILAQVLAGQTPDAQGVRHLVAAAALLPLGMAARAVTSRLFPDGDITYIVDRTLIYSNVCGDGCPHCIGTVPPNHPQAFALSPDAACTAAAAAVDAGARQILLQGGHRNDLPWTYYTDLLRLLGQAFPRLDLVGFSASEVMVWSETYQRPAAELLSELQAAGLAALWMGGAETVTTRWPEHQQLLAGSWPEWSAVARAASQLELPLAVPMPVGIGESAGQRADFLIQLRHLQESGARITALVPLVPLAPAPPTHLAPPKPPEVPEAAPDDLLPAGPEGSGYEYLRAVALCRVVLPRLPHVQAAAVSQGAKVAQIALTCGASDWGGTHLEYKDMELAAARVGAMTAAECERLIRDAGGRPVPRNGRYRPMDATGG